MKQNPRKTLEQVLQESIEVEINEAHVNDWTYCHSGIPFKTLLAEYPESKRGNFNITAAITTPKSIKYRQRDIDFEGGKRGDYLFVDRSGGRMSLPLILFKRLF